MFLNKKINKILLPSILLSLVVLSPPKTFAQSFEFNIAQEFTEDFIKRINQGEIGYIQDILYQEKGPLLNFCEKTLTIAAELLNDVEILNSYESTEKILDDHLNPHGKEIFALSVSTNYIMKPKPNTFTKSFFYVIRANQLQEAFIWIHFPYHQENGMELQAASIDILIPKHGNYVLLDNIKKAMKEKVTERK